MMLYSSNCILYKWYTILIYPITDHDHFDYLIKVSVRLVPHEVSLFSFVILISILWGELWKCPAPLQLFFFKKYLFIYLVALGLSCSRRAP